jgi:hypothetical protein
MQPDGSGEKTCPICRREKAETLRFCCPFCWLNVPAEKRVLLYRMTVRREDTTSAWNAVLKKLRPARRPA